MDRRMTIGVIGAAVLVVGVFCPFTFSARFGVANLFSFSGGELGWPMVLIAGVVLVFTLKGMYRPLLATGVASLGVVLYALYQFHTTSQLVATLNNLVDRVGGSYVNPIELDFGWIVLMLGSVLVVVAATYDSIFKRN